MSVSLEGREPFLDQHIIQWAAQLPSEFKYYKGQKKYILKQIVHQHIPSSIMDRKKMGFSIPVDTWLANELKDLVRTFLSEENLRAHSLFNTIEVNKLVHDFYNGHSEKHVKLWHLLMFQMWYKQWF